MTPPAQAPTAWNSRANISMSTLVESAQAAHIST